jgi:Abortive infection C-terminus
MEHKANSAVLSEAALRILEDWAGPWIEHDPDDLIFLIQNANFSDSIGTWSRLTEEVTRALGKRTPARGDDAKQILTRLLETDPLNTLDAVCRVVSSADFLDDTDQRSADALLGKIDALLKKLTLPYCIQDGRLRRLGNSYLRATAVTPARTIFSRSGFEAAKIEFDKALEDLDGGRFSDAIRKVSNAYESTLKVICKECAPDFKEGASAAALVTRLVDASVLPKYMKNIFEAVGSVSNQAGLRHGAEPGNGPIEDSDLAQFVVHLVATNVCFLMTLVPSKR